MQFCVGDRCYFLRYAHLAEGVEPILSEGDMVTVAKVEPDDVLICFPIDGWGRVFSWEGETLFSEEVLRLPLPPIPTKRLPPPYGEGDNEMPGIDVWKSY